MDDDQELKKKRTAVHMKRVVNQAPKKEGAKIRRACKQTASARRDVCTAAFWESWERRVSEHVLDTVRMLAVGMHNGCLDDCQRLPLNLEHAKRS